MTRDVEELAEDDDSVRFRTEDGVREGDDAVGDDGNLCVICPAANFLRCGEHVGLKLVFR